VNWEKKKENEYQRELKEVEEEIIRLFEQNINGVFFNEEF
jgi:hypothetical protein